MTVRIATVLSARPWESELVRHVQETAAARLVLRAYRPDDVEAAHDEIDVVVTGAEVSWLSPGRIAEWRRLGLVVIGIHSADDSPAAELLRLGGADELIDEITPPEVIVQVARLATPRNPSTPESTHGTFVGVTGTRGAPGITEVALALAWSWGRRRRVALLDLDTSAPALAIRLRLDPRPDVVDATDAVRSGTDLDATLVQGFGHVHAIVGSQRPDTIELHGPIVEDLVTSALCGYDVVVADLGVAVGDTPLLKRTDRAVVVGDGSPVGIVRLARLLGAWSGPPPALVLNRVEAARRRDVGEAVTTWTGLAPDVFLPPLGGAAAAARAARPPIRALQRRLASIEPDA